MSLQIKVCKGRKVSSVYFTSTNLLGTFIQCGARIWLIKIQPNLLYIFNGTAIKNLQNV